jgi:hypothetical protein
MTIIQNTNNYPTKNLYDMIYMIKFTRIKIIGSKWNKLE